MQMHSAESLKIVHGLDDTSTSQKPILRHLRAFFVSGIAFRLLASFQKRRQEIRQYDELLSLPDYLLQDIGLTPGDVRAARGRAKSWFGSDVEI